jgi:single-strand DNA-binding protein
MPHNLGIHKTKIMYSLKNKVQLIGRLGSAPTVKNLETGKKMANLNLATSETYKNAAGEKITETQWHNVVLWGKTAEIAEKYLEKGSEVAIEGKLVHRDYTDKLGAKRYITEVVANEMILMGKKA